MTTRRKKSVTPPSIGDLLSQERRRGGVDVPAELSIRGLAKRAGVSAAQLSRIESGQVAKPRPEILTAVSRALNRNPLPLLIVAGHIEGDEARTQLRELFFREGSEMIDEWGDWTTFTLRDAIERLGDEMTPDAEIAAIAADVFRIQESDETLWDDAYNLVHARGQDAAQLREWMGIWRTAHGYRDWLLECGRLAQRLADLEFAAEPEVDKHTAVAKGKGK